MPPDDSVSEWLDAFRRGDSGAATRIFERYYDRVTKIISRKLRYSKQRNADEEDAVQNAFQSFFVRAKQKKFSQLLTANDLWQLMVVIATRKARKQVRDENRMKRGGGKVRGDSVFGNEADSSKNSGFDGVNGLSPTPEVLVSTREECQRMLDRLPPDHQTVALFKWEGYSHQEIATLTGTSVSTVERRVALIKEAWKNF